MIKNVFLPEYVAGALSHRTLMQKSALDPDVEIKYREEEVKHRDALTPTATFSQTVQKEDGTSKETSQTQPEGSPDSTEELDNKIKRSGRVIKTKGDEDTEEE